MSARILAFPEDPHCVAVLRERELYSGNADALPGALWDDTKIEAVLREAIEVLVARGLCPASWLEAEGIASMVAHPVAATIALRNPSAIVTAEELLRQGMAGTRCVYSGLWTYAELQRDQQSSGKGRYVPGGPSALGVKSIGVASVATMDPRWREATRNSEGKYHEHGAPMVWSCADQILGGPEWVRALYRTGCGLWFVDDDLEVPAFAIILRPGEGFEWPSFEWPSEVTAAEASP